MLKSNYFAGRLRSLSWLLCLTYMLSSTKAIGQTDLPITSLTVSTDTMSHPASVGILMDKLKSIPDLHLAFDQSAMDMNKVVKVPSDKEMTVQEIMALVSNATGMTYEVIGKQIVLKRPIQQKSMQKYTISGQIRDGSTGEDLIGATVRIEDLNIGTVSNVYGFYSLTLQEGSYNLTYSFVGFDSQTIEVNLNGNQQKNIELSESKELLTEVVVVAEKEADFNVTAVEMSAIDVSIETVKKMPALFGEVDVIKTIQLLPGVKTVGEGSSGFYVRGGNVDQNLVLLDEAPIYNASHLFGFFSAFNPEAIKDMKLYKGAIPSTYGGRLSSVLDIRMKEGNSKKFQGSGGIGLLMSRLALEAPVTEKGSFMIGGRRSYIDAMANLYGQARGNGNTDNKFFFYDLNAKANYRFNDKNRLFLSGYFGKDVWAFELSDDFSLGMSGATRRVPLDGTTSFLHDCFPT